MERETMCIQAGYSPKNGESRMIPIIQSTTFKYDTSEDMGKLFDLEASGYFYTRLQNPTNDMVAAKRIPPMIWWQPSSPRSKAVLPVC